MREIDIGIVSLAYGNGNKQQEKVVSAITVNTIINRNKIQPKD